MARFYRAKNPDLGTFKATIYPGYQTPVILNTRGDGLEIESRFWGFVLNMPGKKDPTKLVAKILGVVPKVVRFRVGSRLS